MSIVLLILFISISYVIVRIWTPYTEWFRVKAELLWKIKQALEKEGIEIAFP
jgi:small-conductance mechanosensitive channel